MHLALFDLDNTLLGGDSDYLWGQYLVREGLVDGAAFERENRLHFEAYERGTLDIQAYLRFALRFLSQHPRATLERLHQGFMEKMIRPIILPKGREVIARHKAAGDQVVIITATNRFVTGPIARELGVEHLLASEAEVGPGGDFTGEPVDIPCFQRGKVLRLERWLTQHGGTLEGSWFYSDSHNDLPLLSLVTHPVAVDPDDTLRAHALREGWSIISLRA